MRRTVRVFPSNSIVFVSGPDGGVPPTPVWGAMILSTPSCVSVGCFPECDGETEITLGSIDEVSLNEEPAFAGILKTPEHAVVVSAVGGEPIVKMPVSKDEVDLRIWLSHPRWPEKVTIGVG